MKYCPKLVSEINFEPDFLAPCCNTQNISIPKFPYSGDAINLEAYAEHIQKTLEDLQENGKVCRNCSDIREVETFPGMSGKFGAVSLNMHRFFCNCKCVYCDLWNISHKGYGYDPLPGLISLYEQGALAKQCLIAWGGGEPGILPSFEYTAAWALQHEFYQYIHTNALKYSQSMANILKTNKGKVNISLDSGTSAGYKIVKGVDGFKNVYANLEKYAEINPDNIELKYIVFEKNNSIKEINDFLNIAAKLDIKHLHFSFNFKELQQNAISQKTLYAAAYLNIAAQGLGFDLQTFFIPPKWEKKLSETIQQLNQ